MTSERAMRAANRLRYLLAAERDWPGNRALHAQRRDAWLEVATAGEVRRHWRSRWGALPPWAVRT